QKVTIAGVVLGVRRLTTKKGDAMLTAELEDLTGSVEVIVFPRTLERSADLWREDAVLVVEGKLDLRDERPQVVCESARAWSESAAPAPAGRPARAAGEPPPAGGAARPRRAESSPAPGRNGAATNGHSPPAAARGKAPDEPEARDSGPPPGLAAGERPRVRITIPRRGHVVEDMRLLEAAHALLREHPGDDLYELVLSAGTRRVRLANPHSRVAWSPSLGENLRALLGRDNVEVLDATLNGSAPSAAA